LPKKKLRDALNEPLARAHGTHKELIRRLKGGVAWFGQKGFLALPLGRLVLAVALGIHAAVPQWMALRRAVETPSLFSAAARSAGSMMIVRSASAAAAASMTITRPTRV
jgi:hypothetical protein